MGKYNPYSHNNLHNSQDFRRKNNKKFFIAIAIIVLITFVIAYDVGGIKTLIQEKSKGVTNSTLTTKSPTIKQLSENPENYLNKEITIKGEVGLIAPMTIFQTTNPLITELKLSEYLWEENKKTVPSSKYSFYVKATSSLYTQGWNWKCKGEVKEYKGEYYFEASYCEEI